MFQQETAPPGSLGLSAADAMLPLLTIFVPEIGAYAGQRLEDGRRGVRQTWAIALVVGAVFTITQFAASNYLSVELTDIIAAFAALAAVVIVLRVWTPAGGARRRRPAGRRAPGRRAGERGAGGAGTLVALPAAPVAPTRTKVLMAFFPYALIIAVFSVACCSYCAWWSTCSPPRS